MRGKEELPVLGWVVFCFCFFFSPSLRKTNSATVNSLVDSLDEGSD